MENPLRNRSLDKSNEDAVGSSVGLSHIPDTEEEVALRATHRVVRIRKPTKVIRVQKSPGVRVPDWRAVRIPSNRRSPDS